MRSQTMTPDPIPPSPAPPWKRDLTPEQQATRELESLRDAAHQYRTALTMETASLAAERQRSAELERERNEAVASEQELGAAYMRVRKLVNAFKTNFGGENRFEVTEGEIKKLLSRATEAEGKLAEYRQARKGLQMTPTQPTDLCQCGHERSEHHYVLGFCLLCPCGHCSPQPQPELREARGLPPEPQPVDGKEEKDFRALVAELRRTADGSWHVCLADDFEKLFSSLESTLAMAQHNWQVAEKELKDVTEAYQAQLVTVTRERDEARKLNARYEWNPICTAPVDGTVVLGRLPDSDVPHSVRFREGRWQIAWDNSYLSKYDQPTHWFSLKTLCH